MMKNNYKEPLADQYHILRISRGYERLKELGTVKQFPKNYIFDFRERPPESCYLLVTGRVKVYEDSYSGEHRVYNIMRSGSLFLEEYALFPKPCPVLFTTLTASEIVVIDRCDLIRAMKSDIDISLDLLDSVCGKFVSSMETQRIGSRQNTEWKICRMIISDLENYGEKYKDGMYVKDKISHQMTAEILGLNRVTVTRKLKKLAEMGLISKHKGHLYVPDIDALLTYMDSLELEEDQ